MKLWTDGQRIRIGSKPKAGESQVDPAWSRSPAAVLRYIGEHQEVTHDQLVAIRRLCVAAGGEGVNPAHVAVAVLMQLQSGQSVDRVLAIEPKQWHQLVKAFNL